MPPLQLPLPDDKGLAGGRKGGLFISVAFKVLRTLPIQGSKCPESLKADIQECESQKSPTVRLHNSPFISLQKKKNKCIQKTLEEIQLL